jgi:hypothetical protein
MMVSLSTTSKCIIRINIYFEGYRRVMLKKFVVSINAARESPYFVQTDDNVLVMWL